MLALDLDPARVAHDVHDGAVRHRHDRDGGLAGAGCQAEVLGELVARCGGQVLVDVSPGGGRHVFVLFSTPLPWRELRDLCRAIALQFPAVDPAPMCSLGGQISPPGSRHKSGGWRLLTTPLGQARATVEQPNGPGVWLALLAEFAAELRAVERAAESQAADQGFTELDDAGIPWLSQLGGRAPLGGELERVARTGRWDRSRYPGRSEARMAVLAAAAGRGWQLADVLAAVAAGAWTGFPGLYERRSEPGRMDRLLAAEWPTAAQRHSGAAGPRV